jgi:hypothetical protein
MSPSASPHSIRGGSYVFCTNITLSVSQYRARSPSLSRYSYRCIRPQHATYAVTTSIVCRRLGACSSAVYRHEAQTTLSIANIKFTTSTPGVARNLYRSCGSEISLVWVRFCFPANFPQREFKQSFARPRLAALGLIPSLSISTPSLASKVVT